MNHLVAVNARCRSNFSILFGVFISGMMLPTFSLAQEPTQINTDANFVEAGGNYYDLSADNSSWTGYFARGSWQADENNILNWEVSRQNRYGDSGTYLVTGLVHAIDEDWITSFYVGGSPGGFYFQKYRIDAFIHRKLLSERNLVLTAGATYAESRDDIHDDTGFFVGAAYYFSFPLLVEGGIRYNQSDPGLQQSLRYQMSATYGRSFDRYISVAIDTGNESYQLIGEGNAVSNFESTVATIGWREWIREDWGFNLTAEYYTSEIYNRSGAALSVFKHF
ncbi:MAG: YaiO family outer membrane beta-barrel protein [Gammaproteobacteria bacterium]